jgi:hypothetical protein
MSNLAGVYPANLRCRKPHVRTTAWGVVAACLLSPFLGLSPASPAAAQSLIEGVDQWAEATARSAAPKWGGPRVLFPSPRPRPESAGRLESLRVPLSVHAAAGVPAARVQAVLAAAEDALALLELTGWSASFGDAGEGGTPGRDLYVVTHGMERGAEARVDAAEPFRDLDGARAFAVLDARIPASRVEACTAQALAETLLLELDPAEADSVRRSVAAYLSWLITGEMGCDDEENGRRDTPYLAAMGPEPSGRGANWLAQLGQRQDLNTGLFVHDMWQFARQRTWEGTGLRASPDLFEAVASALARRDEQLENVAAELAEREALGWLADDARKKAKTGKPKSPSPFVQVSWSKLPARLPAADPPLEPLGSYFALVTIDRPVVAGDRLRAWSRGEFGTRWALSVSALDASRKVLARVLAPPRKNPSSFVTLELPLQTAEVLISVTNVADGIPDADPGAPFEVHSLALIVDRGGDETVSAVGP